MVGKDLNFSSIVYVDAAVREQVMNQLKIDTWFLQTKHLMDYSLLIGIAPVAATPTGGVEANQGDGGGGSVGAASASALQDEVDGGAWLRDHSLAALFSPRAVSYGSGY
jgi:hypothetical protein